MVRLGIAAGAVASGVLLALVGSQSSAAAARGATSPCVLQILCPTTTTTATLPPPPTPTTTTTTTPSRPGHRHNSRPPVVYPGATYVGRSTSFSYVVSIVVSKGGSEIRGLFDEFRRGRCTDSDRYASDANVGGHWRIRRNGSAIVMLRSGRSYTFDKRGHRLNGTESQALHFRFSGNRLDGTLVDRFSGRGLRCASGTIRFRASRIGSSGAPLVDGGAISGTYSGNSPAGRWSFYAYVPLHMISFVSYHWRLHCPHDKTYKFRTEFVNVPLQPFGEGHDTFSARAFASVHHGPRGRGYTVESTVSVAGFITLASSERDDQLTLRATAQLNPVGSLDAISDYTGGPYYSCSGGYTAKGRTKSTLRLAPGQTVPYRNDRDSFAGPTT